MRERPSIPDGSELQEGAKGRAESKWKPGSEFPLGQDWEASFAASSTPGKRRPKQQPCGKMAHEGELQEVPVQGTRSTPWCC